MELPSAQLPPEDEPVSPARRRRARRRVIAPLTPDEKTAYIEAVLRKAAPSFDFFLFSLLAGAIMGLGFILDSPYFLLLGALLAPIMAPVVGIGLGTVLGSYRYFGRSLGGLLIGGFLVIFSGALAGFASRLLFPNLLRLQAPAHAQLHWHSLIVLAIGAAITAATLVREKQHPGIPSVAVAYGLYLPLSAAGFGLGSGIPNIWPDGLVLFLIHLAWIILVGAVTLAVMGFRPYTLFGYSIGGVVLLVAVILAFGFFGFGAVVGTGVALPTSPPTPAPTHTPSLTPTITPVPPTGTPTPSRTPTPSVTPTPTFTPSPTPVQGIVRSDVSGVVIREQPDITSPIVSRLVNGSLLEILGQVETDNLGRSWLHVFDYQNNVEGWILQTLVITATPEPPVTPATPTPTRTPTPSPTPTSTPQPSPG